jgi:hypothetical protein
METRTFFLAYSDSVNRNGYVMSEKVFKEAVEGAGEFLEKGILPLLSEYQDYHLEGVPFDKLIGTVSDINIEKLEATASIKPEYDIKGLVLGLAYVATDYERKDDTLIVNKAKIMYATLLPEENSAYRE